MIKGSKKYGTEWCHISMAPFSAIRVLLTGHCQPFKILSTLGADQFTNVRQSTHGAFY